NRLVSIRLKYGKDNPMGLRELFPTQGLRDRLIKEASAAVDDYPIAPRSCQEPLLKLVQLFGQDEHVAKKVPEIVGRLVRKAVPEHHAASDKTLGDMLDITRGLAEAARNRYDRLFKGRGGVGSVNLILKDMSETWESLMMKKAERQGAERTRPEMM